MPQERQRKQPAKEGRAVEDDIPVGNKDLKAASPDWNLPHLNPSYWTVKGHWRMRHVSEILLGNRFSY